MRDGWRSWAGRLNAGGRFGVSLPILIGVMAVVAVPLISGRVLGGQDIVNYLIHAQQTAENLREGVVWPSWSGGYYSGFGSPVLLFFPPLTSYVGAMAVLVGVPVILGVGWLAVLAHLLSGMAVLGWLRSAGYRHAALPASILYMVAPYRFIDLYLRSALGEHWAFLWPPLIIWIGSSSRIRPARRVTLTALTVAGLLLTNVPLAVLFGLGLGLWFAVSRAIDGNRRSIASGAALGFGLAAFSLFPTAYASTVLDLEACFGSSVERFRPSSNTLFAAGFAGDDLNTVFSWCLVATVLLVFVGWVFLEKEKRSTRGARLLALGAVFCLVAATGTAGPVWDAVPVLRNLQFPWRITALITLLAASMTARLRPVRAWMVAVLAGVLAVPFSGWDWTKPIELFRTEPPLVDVPAGTVFPNPTTAWEAGSGGWYWRHHKLAALCLLPATMPRSLLRELAGATQPEFRDIRGRPAVVLEDPGLRVRVREWIQQARTIDVETPTPGTLMWRVLWFPDMRVTIDGLQVAYWVDEETGLVVHELPAGSHHVELRWIPYPMLAGARLVSIVSLLAVALLAIAGSIRQRRRESG